MIFSKKAAGILGMNARNLLYISRYNSRGSKKFADDKIFTKQFLNSRGVGVARLYHQIKSYQALSAKFFQSLPESFVIKPNRGYAGAGIIVVVGKKNDKWLSASGKKYTEEFLYQHCISILEGKYSISGVHDTVIFEEKLDPHPEFRLLTNAGLPDVRVIVFNMVPVMAMLRVPTAESEGKANMELGAIAMGIDLGNGKTTGAAFKSQFVKKLPNGERAAGFQVPFWDDILLSVSKIQQSTKIGFLGVDLVVTKSGVKVLEVNARPGLKIQVANQTPLRKRLDKVMDLKVLTPEDGVEVAKTLFAEKGIIEAEFQVKPVIGVEEAVVLNAGKDHSLIAKIDLLAENNKISAKYYDEKEKVLDITLQGKRLKLPVEKGRIVGADLQLAGKFLKDFYIDPNKKFDPNVQISGVLTAQVEARMLQNIDAKICDLDSEIKLLSYINPQNLAEQKKIFLSHSDTSPRFFYRDCGLDFSYLRNELKKIPVVNHVLYPLYAAKIAEIEAKLNLLESIDSVEFGNFSTQIFGGVTKTLYQAAVRFLRQQLPHLRADESELYDHKKTVEVLKKFLDRYHLGH